MYNHASENYQCPLCLIIKGQDNPENFAKVADIFYKDEDLTAFIGGKWWPKNDGNVIIIPNKHYENIYDLPQDIGHKVFDLSKKIAIALKEVYKCDGVSTRQHNEPAGNQDVFHYHFHIIPRYTDDDFYINFKNVRWTTVEERAPFAAKLRKYFNYE
nr:HIT domain protein [uncultured bacterium]